MQEQVEHNGRIAVVHVEEVGKGKWTWWYSIDGKGVHRGTDRPLPDQDMALREGKDAALDALGYRRV